MINNQKRIFVCDIFSPDTDFTTNLYGMKMANIYLRYLEAFEGKSQWEIFSALTSKCNNIIVLKVDSKKAVFDTKEICLGIIDGNHSPDYIKNDFYLIWPKLVQGGCLIFDDYGGDLPSVTMEINKLFKKYNHEILRYDYFKPKNLLFLIKR